ncbi:serine hydrolase [Kineococcus sp. SYSU DK001]|uniref:serine hydrolase n=1 Tax=Kineococcus sp. SYSU DK001 TaxID=3383122 RepID=UPI003D7CE3D2
MDVSRRAVVAAGVGTGLLAALDPAPDEVTFWAQDLFTGRCARHRSEETRPVLTLSAGPALGLLLHERGRAALAEEVRYGPGDVVGASPVCGWHVGTGLPVGRLGDAALRRGDATATNLLLRRGGGAAAVTGFCRRLGDRRTRLDRSAPQSCTAAPWDPRDTTTTAELARTHGRLVLGAALPPVDRAALLALFPTTALPGGWSLTHASSTGRYGTAVLVGTARRGRRVVLAAATVRAGQPGVVGSRSAVTGVVSALLTELDATW